MSDAPIFEPPERSVCVPCGDRPVDLVFLARQTGGDRALEEEVLRLFARQAQTLGEEFRRAEDRELRKSKAHTLKGAARAVGAFQLAECAFQAENEPEQGESLTAMLREVETVRDYIASLLR